MMHENENMTKKISKSATKDLLSELHAKCVTTSDTSKLEKKVEQKVQQKEKQKEKQQVKLRDVKDYVKEKTTDELSQDSRVVVREHRDYMISATHDDRYNVFNATMYRDSKNELQLLTQELANKFVSEYVQKLALKAKFTAQDIMRLHSTCGGAYGDKIRNALYSMSQIITEEQLESLTADDIKAMQAKHKCCVYFNVISDSRRARYNFVKLC